MSHALGIKVEDFRDRTLYHLFSADVAASLLDLRIQTDVGDTKDYVMEIKIADQNYIYDVSAAALQEGEYSGSALYVLHDITTVKRAQEKHNCLLEGIISTLVHAVDMHDPHCANHSERTREVAVAVAEAGGA